MGSAAISTGVRVVEACGLWRCRKHIGAGRCCWLVRNRNRPAEDERPCLAGFGHRAYGRRCGALGLSRPRGQPCAHRCMAWPWAVPRGRWDSCGGPRDRCRAPLVARPSGLRRGWPPFVALFYHVLVFLWPQHCNVRLGGHLLVPSPRAGGELVSYAVSRKIASFSAPCSTSLVSSTSGSLELEKAKEGAVAFAHAAVSPARNERHASAGLPAISPRSSRRGSRADALR